MLTLHPLRLKDPAVVQYQEGVEPRCAPTAVPQWAVHPHVSLNTKTEQSTRGA